MRVIFDIGHGADTYPPSKGIKYPDGTVFAEHFYNSKVAMRAKALAESQGIEVLLTQQPFANNVSLNERIEWANQNSGDVDALISFHANYSNDKKVDGYGVFHWCDDKESEDLAVDWLTNAAKMMPNGKWGDGYWLSTSGSWSDYAILRETNMPSILIEHFFFSNRAEYELMTTDESIQAAAETTVKALCDYLGVAFKPKTVPEILKECMNEPDRWEDFFNNIKYGDEIIKKLYYHDKNA